MSHNLSQPEEVDLALSEIDATERISTAQQTEFEQRDEVSRDSWHCGYVSPYRAAHMGLLHQ